jgi:hypothetical protein
MTSGTDIEIPDAFKKLRRETPELLSFTFSSSLICRLLLMAERELTGIYTMSRMRRS